MTDLPPPVLLDQPPGSPTAVAEAAANARWAARALGDLAEQVSGARLPGWRGDDAEAVAQRCGSVARLASQVEESLHRLATRLASHAELWTAVRARIAAMLVEQEEDFRRARPLGVGELDLADLTGSARAEAQAWLSVAESRRAAEHRHLLDRLAEDAATTRAVLAGCLAAVGAGGRHGTDGAVLHLADVLPGWGLPEVGRRARALAESLTGRRGAAGDASGVDALVRAELPFAGHLHYAATFLRVLGPEHVQALLAATWNGGWTQTPLPDLLGRVLAGLDRAAATPAWLPTLLDDALDGGMHPGVVGGLAAALASARRQGRPGPPPALAAAWAESLLAVERAADPRATPAVPPSGADPLTTDPLALVLDAIVRQRAVGEAAALMRSAEAWEVVLGRSTDDGGTLLDGLVRTVAEAPPATARPALRSALLAIGTGLEDSDPVDWPVQLQVVERAAPVLASALARHVEEVREGLAAAAAGVASADEATVLRGLSVVLDLHDEAEHVIARALAAVGRQVPGVPPGVPAIGSSVVVTTALAAVAEHGRWLTGAMHEHEEKRRVEGRARLWGVTYGLPFTLAGLTPGMGRVTGVVESVVTRLLGTNGYHVNDLRLDEGSGFRLGSGADGSPELSGRDRQALLGTGLRAFLATRDALGHVRLPDETDPGVLRDLAAALAGDVAGGTITRGLRDHPLLGEGVGAVAGDEVAGTVRGG